VHVPVHGISSHDQPERRDVQGAGTVGVDITQFDRLQLFALELDHIVVAENIGDHVILRYLAGEAWTPEPIEPTRAPLRAHVFHHAGGGHQLGRRKALEDGVHQDCAEPTRYIDSRTLRLADGAYHFQYRRKRASWPWPT